MLWTLQPCIMDPATVCICISCLSRHDDCLRWLLLAEDGPRLTAQIALRDFDGRTVPEQVGRQIDSRKTAVRQPFYMGWTRIDGARVDGLMD